MRSAGNEGGESYDVDAMIRAAEAEGVGKPNGRGGITGWTGFGGEFLLTPLPVIERLFAWSSSINAPIGLQTNAASISEKHFELFQKYRVSVGVSVDGPEDLNDWRQAKNPAMTRTLTTRSIANLERLLRDGISTSLIVTLSAHNAGSDDKLSRLIAWLLGLRDLGMKHLNIHLLETGHGPNDTAHALSQERQIEALRRLRRELIGFSHVSPFDDMRAKLTEGQANCVWNACSPYSTPAVSGIGPHGERSRCGRLNTDGVPWERSQTHGHERYLSLFLTPMSKGGCGGCRFWLACFGNCPGEGEGSDWRNRTRHCPSLLALFDDIEADLFAEGKEPISMSLRRPGLEAQKLSQWSGLPVEVNSPASGNRPHGDIPHGDKVHQDHHDRGKVA